MKSHQSHDLHEQLQNSNASKKFAKNIIIVTSLGSGLSISQARPWALQSLSPAWHWAWQGWACLWLEAQPGTSLKLMSDTSCLQILLLWPNFVKLKFVNSSPSTLVEVTKWRSVSSITLIELQWWWYTTQGLWVIEGSRVYEGQESTYSSSEDLWWRGTELCLQSRDSEDKGQRTKDKGSRRSLTRYSGIFE